MNKQPLVVDLDGTLLKSDLLFESIWKLIKSNPLYIFFIFFWLSKGKSFLKYKVASKVDIDFSYMPFNESLIEFIKKQKNSRKIILASASNEKYVKKVSDFLGFFNHFLASSKSLNLSKQTKVDELKKLLNNDKYIYVGNSSDDIPIWQSCGSAIFVNTPNKIKKKLENKNVDFLGEFNFTSSNFKKWTECLRVHQWVKNLLIFVPLFLSKELLVVGSVYNAILAFFIFSFCASSIYILNDLLDLDDDRQHPTKCLRPIASGQFPISNATFIFPILILISFLLASLMLSFYFLMALLTYLLTTIAYSFYLKRRVLIDVIALASLYTLRIVAGILAIDAEFSFWLLTFSIFIFMSLALMKRYTELLQIIKLKLKTPSGRSYIVDDINFLLPLGVSSGYISILVFALFINSMSLGKYKSPEFLWLMIPVFLYWISRTWLIAHRGEMQDDPIIFALRDKTSIVTLLISLSIFSISFFL